MSVSFPSRVLGFVLMAVTIGLASCQALFLEPPPPPPAIEQADEG